MNRPFWTAGAIPAAMLASHALPRPDATAAIVATLREGRVAAIGGQPGEGRSTLALQAAKEQGRGALFLDGTTAPTDGLRALLADAIRIDGRRARPEWSAIENALRQTDDTILIIDGGPASIADRLSQQLDTSIIHITTDGIPPDPIRPEAAQAFLQRRSQTRGVAWTTDALALAASVAAGRPDLLQWLGHNALALSTTRVEEETVLDAVAIAAEHLPTWQAARLARLHGPRADLLKAVARRPDATPSEWGAIAGVPANAVTVHLARLVQEDLLTKRGRGDYALTSPLVTAYLRGRFGTIAQLIRP